MFGTINISGRNNPHPSILPANLCKVIPGQLYKQKVPEYLTAKVVEFLKIKPQDRFRKISQSVLTFPSVFLWGHREICESSAITCESLVGKFLQWGSTDTPVSLIPSASSADVTFWLIQEMEISCIWQQGWTSLLFQLIAMIFKHFLTDSDFSWHWLIK